MRHINALFLGLTVIGGATAIAAPAQAATSCADLRKSLNLPHVTITLAEEVPAGGFKPAGPAGLGGAPGGNYASLPAFCRVAAMSKPTPDSDIRFEVWMPLDGWNGKFVGGGNGVWAGSIAYGDMTGPLARGYATAASDVGHQGSPLDGTFLVGHPEKLIDFGHRAVHETAVAAKATIAAFYGSGPKRSLYASCSTGGRIGLMEAYRYPEDYDAISATAPANPMVPLMIMSLWTGAATMKDEASQVPPPKLQLVQKAALEACDAQDAVKDGIIANPPACRFDPGVLQCKAGDAPDCLTAPQVAAMRAIYAGPKNPRTGKQIYPGLAVGSEAQMPALTTGKEPFPVATTFFKGPVFNDPAWDFRSFDYDKDSQKAMDYGSKALDIPPTGLGPLLQGWSQAAALAWLGRWTHSRAVHGEFPRRAGQEHRKEEGTGWRAPVHGAGHGALRRRQWTFSHRLPGRHRPMGGDRQGAGAAHGQQSTQPDGAYATALPASAGCEVQGQGSTDEEQNFSCAAP